MLIGTTHPVTSPKSVAELHHAKATNTATPKRSRTKTNQGHLSKPMSDHQTQQHNLPLKRSSSQFDDVNSTPPAVAITASAGGMVTANAVVNASAAPSNGAKPKEKKRRNWAPIPVVKMKEIKLPTDVEPEALLKLKLQYQDMATMEQQIYGISTLLSLVKNVLKGSADLKRIAALGRRLSKTRKRFLNVQRGVFDVQNERNPAPVGESNNNVATTPATAESNDASSRPSQASNRSDTDTSMQTAALQVSTPEKKNTAASATATAPVPLDTVGSLLTSENAPDENPTFPQFSLGGSGVEQPQVFQPEYQQQQQAQSQQIRPPQLQQQDEDEKQRNEAQHSQQQQQQQIVPSQPMNQTTTPLEMAQHPEIQGLWQQQFPMDTSSHMENNALSMALSHNQPQNTMGQHCLQPLNKNVFVKGQLDPKKLPIVNGRPINSQEHYLDAQRVAFERQQQRQETLDAFASVASDVHVHPTTTSGLDAFQQVAAAQQAAGVNKFAPMLSSDSVASGGGGGSSSLLPNNSGNTRDGNGLFPMQLSTPDMGQHNHSFFPTGMQREPQQQQPNVTPSPNVQPPTPLDIQQQTLQAMLQQQHQPPQQFGMDASAPMHHTNAAALSVAFGQAPNLVTDPTWLQQDGNYAAQAQAPVQPLQVPMPMPGMKPNIPSPVEFFAAHYGGGSDFGSTMDRAAGAVGVPSPPGHLAFAGAEHHALPPAQQPFEQRVSSKLAVECVAPDAAETNFSPVTTSGHMY